MPKNAADPTPTSPKAPAGSWLAIGVWILIAVVNLLVVVVDGALWGIGVAIVAIVLAGLTYKQMRDRQQAP